MGHGVSGVVSAVCLSAGAGVNRADADVDADADKSGKKGDAEGRKGVKETPATAVEITLIKVAASRGDSLPPADPPYLGVADSDPGRDRHKDEAGDRDKDEAV